MYQNNKIILKRSAYGALLEQRDGTCSKLNDPSSGAGGLLNALSMFILTFVAGNINF